MDVENLTTPLRSKNAVLEYRGFSLRVVKGPDAGKAGAFEQRSIEIGTAAECEFQLTDRAVSRHHAVIDITEEGYRIRDEQSRNGTRVGGCRVPWAILATGVEFQVGSSTLRFDLGDTEHRIELAEHDVFGPMIGRSTAMRELYATLEKVAKADITVLLEGESGVGKELAAQAIHDASARAGKPFEVFDCASVPENLAESELLGHERGAFTGAAGKRIGAFERAAGGTIFLDEIGELPEALQPKLLRVLDAREFRAVGASQTTRVDVRVVAATNRDLAEMVKQGKFRLDLYHRLAVVRVRIPPLRHRPEDLPLLIDRFLASARAQGHPTPHLSQEAIARLQSYSWPGNVRELRNFVERGVLLEEDFAALPFDTSLEPHALGGASTEAPAGATLAPPPIPSGLGEAAAAGVMPPYHDAKTRLVDDWEREYCTRILELYTGNISGAARAAGLDRKSFKYLLTKHGIKPERE